MSIINTNQALNFMTNVERFQPNKDVPPILRDEGNEKLLPTSPPKPTEVTTNQVAIHTIGTTSEGENQPVVFTPLYSVNRTQTTLTEGIDQESTLSSVSKQHQATSATLLTDNQQSTQSKAISSENLEKINRKWVGIYQEDLIQRTPDDLCQLIQKRRAEIKEVKDEFLKKQQQAYTLKDQLSIAKIEFNNLHEQLSREKAFSPPNQSEIELIRKQIEETVKQLTTLESDLLLIEHFISSPDRALHVNELMETGSLSPIDEGKSGVYFLRDFEDNPKYVIKPYDEDMLTLNNSKGFALPFHDNDGYGRPKQGIPLYSALQNEELTGQVAHQLGINRCTVNSELMVLESPVFADITDDLNANSNEITDAFGVPDKEKLCIVQDFIPNCQEIGDIILTGANKTKEEYMNMDEDERYDLQRTICPNDINHEMYEEAVILALVCGEADGNAGNWMVGKEVNPNTGLRDFYKIDNAANFTEDNVSLRVGAVWVINNFEKPLTSYGRELIRKINRNDVSALMKSRGASEKSVAAAQDRIWLMQEVEKMLEEENTVEYFELLVTAYLEGESSNE